MQAGSHVSVLVIDEDRDFAATAERLLTRRDRRVVLTAGPEEGLGRFRSNPFEVVVLDTRCDGPPYATVVKDMLRIDLDTRVIATSADAAPHDATAALRAGACDYLTKPLAEPTALTDAVDRAAEALRISRIYRDLREHLHEMVVAKTAELTRINDRLQQANIALEAKNIALTEVLNAIETQKRETIEAVGRQIDEQVLPLLHGQREAVGPAERRRVDAIEQCLREIGSPFLDKLHRSLAALTPGERRLCAMIRRNLANKEIAQLANLSPQTVKAHRRNIRRKLGLTHSDSDLGAYLNSLLVD